MIAMHFSIPNRPLLFAHGESLTQGGQVCLITILTVHQSIYGKLPELLYLLSTMIMLSEYL